MHTVILYSLCVCSNHVMFKLKLVCISCIPNQTLSFLWHVLTFMHWPYNRRWYGSGLWVG